MKIVYVLDGLALLMASAPWLAVRRLQPTAESLRKMRGVAAFIVALVLSSLLELSFASHWLNVALCGLALLCAARLAVWCLQAKQRLPWLPVGVLGLLGVFACVVAGALSVAVEGRVIEVAAADGRVCRWSTYGFVTGDSGAVLDVYRRYGVVDVPLGRIVRSDVSPETNVPLPAVLQHTVGECDGKINAILRQG